MRSACGLSSGSPPERFLIKAWGKYAFTFLILFSSSGNILWASIPDAFGLTGELIGRSGAGNGVTESYSAAYYNPAALALPRSDSQAVSHQLGGGFLFQKPDMAINTVQGSTLAQNNAAIGADVDAYGVQVFGGIFDLRSLIRTPYQVPVKIGVAFASPAPETGRLAETSQQFYTFQQIGRQSAIPNAAVSLGFQAWRGSGGCRSNGGVSQ